MNVLRFLTSNRALIASAMALMLILVACSSADETPTDDTAEATPGAGADATDASGASEPAGGEPAEPGEVEELVIAVPDLGTGGIVDPILSILDDKPYNRLVYTYLFDTGLDDKELSESNSLAESWEWQDDAQTELHVTLREGVMFHNGEEMTAADVAFSLDRLSDPEARAPYAGTILELLDEVEVLGDYELVLHLTESSLEFIPTLSPIAGGSEGFVVPQAYLEEVGADGFRAEPVGTGPYRIVEFESGSVLELEAFDDYFLGEPAIDRIRFEVTPELSTRISQLETGQVDIAAISRETAPSVEDSGFKLFSKSGGDVVALNPQVWGTIDDDPLEDERVRQALFTSINYEEINEFLLNGKGTLTNNYIFEGSAIGGEHIPPYEFDPEGAQQLLADAGYEEGDLSLTLYGATKNAVPEIPDMAQAIADYWSTIGVQTEIVLEDYATMRPKIVDRGLEVPSLRIHSVDSRAINGPLLENIFGCPEGQVWAMCPPGDYADIMAQLSEAETIEEYGELQQAAAQAMSDTYANAVIAVASPIYATNDKVADWDLGGTAYDVNYKYLALSYLD